MEKNEILEINYIMEKVNDQNIETMLNEMGLNNDCYFMTMTKSSLLKIAVVGNVVQFANQYCIINFSEDNLRLFMLSRVNSKKVTNVINISKSEIKEIKISNVLISYMFKIRFNDSSMNFQLFKKVNGIKKQKENIEKFRKYYQC